MATTRTKPRRTTLCGTPLAIRGRPSRRYPHFLHQASNTHRASYPTNLLRRRLLLLRRESRTTCTARDIQTNIAIRRRNRPAGGPSYAEGRDDPRSSRGQLPNSNGCARHTRAKHMCTRQTSPRTWMARAPRRTSPPRLLRGWLQPTQELSLRVLQGCSSHLAGWRRGTPT